MPLVNSSSKLKNEVVSLGTGSTTIYTVPSNFTSTISLLALTNIDTSSARTFDLSYTPQGGSAQQIIDAYSIATATNIVYIFDKEKQFTMNAGDVLSGVGSSADKIIAVLSAEEFFNPAS